MLGYDYPLLSIFFSMLWFFLFFIWIMLLFRIIMDIFRDHTSNGFAKFAWIVFIIVLPFLGAFVYIIAKGNSMAEREVSSMQQQQAATDAYIRQTAGTSSGADELARLAELKEKGVIDDAEFAAMKAKVIG
jgi:hypothetical protein